MKCTVQPVNLHWSVLWRLCRHGAWTSTCEACFSKAEEEKLELIPFWPNLLGLAVWGWLRRLCGVRLVFPRVWFRAFSLTLTQRTPWRRRRGGTGLCHLLCSGPLTKQKKQKPRGSGSRAGWPVRGSWVPALPQQTLCRGNTNTDEASIRLWSDPTELRLPIQTEKRRIYDDVEETSWKQGTYPCFQHVLVAFFQRWRKYIK